MMKLSRKIVCSLALLASSMQAFSALDIVITEGVNQARSIAIVPFEIKAKNKSILELSSVIRSDLRRSGQFNPMKISRLPSQTFEIKDDDIDDWIKTGVEAIVVGRIEPVKQKKKQTKQVSPQYLVKFELIDVVRLSMSRGQTTAKQKTQADYNYILESREMVVKESQLRQYAHRISDLVYQKLTGTRGAFLTRIAYVSVNRKAEYPFRLMVADYDGHNEQLLLRSKKTLMSPSWHPDGKHIVYVTFENKRSEIYIQNLYTQKRKKITGFPGINGAPEFSPDGRYLALSLSKDGNPEVYTYDLQTKKLKRITYHYGIDTEPVWSVDGESLIFTSERGGKPQIYSVNLITKKIKRLTYEGTQNLNPLAAPDGRNILYVTLTNGKYHIAKMDLTNHFVQVLTTTRLDESPAISPNGGMIIYGTTYLGRSILGAVSLDGRFKARLPATDGEIMDPCWSPFL